MLTADLSFADLAPAARRAPGYAGPERRTRAASPLTHWLTATLDEMAHGVLLVSPDGLLCHANQPARDELLLGDTLRLLQGRVSPRRADEHPRFVQALHEASTGRRRLFSVGDPGEPLSIAAVPLPAGADRGDPLALLVLGRRQHVETLTVDFYARTQGLTGAEANVLRALCKGLRPKEVARECGVAVSTVRTQISSIRHKTQSLSIRALLDRVAALPPITSAMKSCAPH